MLCNYCLQLLQFSQGVTPHAPQERTLRGDTTGFTNAQPRQSADVPSLRLKKYEQYARPGNDKPLWWTAPAHIEGLQALLSHSTEVDCNLCMMIFSSISASIVEAALPLVSDYPFFVNSLRTAASIVGALRRLPLDSNSPFFVHRLATGKGLEDHNITTWLEVCGRLLDRIWLQLTVEVETKAPNRFPFHESPGTGSRGTSILAASWLENCLANHPGCKYERDECQRTPSRLIDVGDENGTRPPHIWSPGTASVPYITLSHRWGTGNRIVLTKASLPAMSQRIDLASLPQTYQDAIAITRLLGLRYLWIDSLCIIQDSMVDWQTEAAKMGDIFKFSFCTIAASWASSDSEGCFFDRRPLYAKFSLSQAAEPATRLLSNLHPREGYGKGRNRLRLDTIPQAEPDSKKKRFTKFECILERRRSTLCTEIAGFNQDLNPSSLTYSSCRPASTIPLAVDAKLFGGEGFGTIAPEPTVQSVSKREYDMENIPPSSNEPDALESPAKISISSESERYTSTANSAIQHTLCDPGRRESAVLYITPLQTDLWADSVELSPLSRRAWVLQERLLSPRTLHYTKRQLFWECRASKACESSPNPCPKSRLDHFDVPTCRESTHELCGLDAEPLDRHWPKIIEKYTDTLMTKLEDKLVAISGLARQVHSITKDKYCAGIWREDLVTQLLWQLQTPQHKLDLPYRAPSWSWASTEGKVEFMQKANHIISELEIKSVQSIGVDGRPWSFGQIEYGSLRVRCTMRAAKRCDRHGQTYKLLLTDQFDEELDTHECDYYPDSIPQSLSETPICLPVARLLSGASAGADENNQHGFVAGLVIVPTGDYADEYRRLGCFLVAANAGTAWFVLGQGQLLWDLTLV